jgi:hypothetical protein
MNPTALVIDRTVRRADHREQATLQPASGGRLQQVPSGPRSGSAIGQAGGTVRVTPGRRTARHPGGPDEGWRILVCLHRLERLAKNASLHGRP